jgi:hypothetical protein
MQNSAERLLTGIAAALRDVTAPDAYDRAQLAAAAELLDNLAGRLEWRHDDTQETLLRLQALLEDAVAQDDGLPQTREWLAGPRDDVVGALEALAEVQTRVDPGSALAARTRAFARWQLERDVAQLRTGMYSRRDLPNSR